MPLESCMILLDNSEFMRNGDYIPTRLGAQHDAANLLVTQKTRSNPESTVGVLAMSGGKYMHSGGGGEIASSSATAASSSSSSSSSSANMELLVTPTDDIGKILSALHGIPIRGGAAAGRDAISTPTGVDISASIHVASLALKHRRNKNGQQRIVLFVGSPLTHVDSRILVKTGKTLKKNNVALDVVAMGELEENEMKLRELVDAANGGGDTAERNCHLVTIPPGVLPSDVLLSSPIFHGGATESIPGETGAGAFDEFGGIDPNMDPELAMALRISMEEERARQERVAREQEQQQANQVPTSNNSSSSANALHSSDVAMEATSESTAIYPITHDDEMSDEDALLQQALAMSMAESQTQATSLVNSIQTKPTSHPEVEYDDTEMLMALEMSMQDSEMDSGNEKLGQSSVDTSAANNALTQLGPEALETQTKKNTEDENHDKDNQENPNNNN